MVMVRTTSSSPVNARRGWLWRRLLPQEQAFVRQCFGEAQGAWLIAQVRLGQRRLGDTRRALSLYGAWVSLPKAMYVQSDWRQPLRVTHPVVAGLLAHELLHVLQRKQGLAVTRQAFRLQWRFLCWGQDPYCYSCSGSAIQLLRQFWLANVEQQGQMWQDCVQAHVAGQPLASHALLTMAVQRGRFRRCGQEIGNSQQ